MTELQRNLLIMKWPDLHLLSDEDLVRVFCYANRIIYVDYERSMGLVRVQFLDDSPFLPITVLIIPRREKCLANIVNYEAAE